jgi:MFS family permease
VADRPRHVLPTIVAAQFAGTSLWFAGNAVLPELRAAYGLPADLLGPLTIAVQLGFIVGTLLYAASRVVDRVSPRLVFLASSLAGALCNLALAGAVEGPVALLAARFGTGLFLAGVYPVGMAIAADWYRRGLGRALGWLVGALVLGTAFPHLLRFLAAGLPWQSVLVGASTLAAAGGVGLAAAVPDGPYRRRAAAFRPGAVAQLARVPAFRAAALGYFGHMWELYAFWAFVPPLIASRAPAASSEVVSLASFAVIAAGAVGCLAGGYAAERVGSGRVAGALLATSCAACLASPFVGAQAGPWLALLLGVWGVAVAGDSPQFSALVARAAPAEVRGSALTAVTSLGFLLTLPAIALLNRWVGAAGTVPEWLFLALAPGPALGLLALARPGRRRAT